MKKGKKGEDEEELFRAKMGYEEEGCRHCGEWLDGGKNVRERILNPSLWTCGTCGLSFGVHACLFCGNVACGSETKSHHVAHFRASGHPIVLDINTKAVFCFACKKELFVSDTKPDSMIAVLRKDLTLVQESAQSPGSPSDELEAPPVQRRRSDRLLRSRSRFQLTPEQFKRKDKLENARLFRRNSLLAFCFEKFRNALIECPGDVVMKEEEAPPPQKSPSPRKTAQEKKLAVVMKKKYIPGRCGLRNVGNTCFMNSVLQALACIPEFRDFFISFEWTGTMPVQRRDTVDCMAALKERKGSADLYGLRKTQRGAAVAETEDSEVNFSMLLHELYRVMWSGKSAICTPFALLESLWMIAPRFRGYQQQDAHEFFQALLDRVETEVVAAYMGHATPPLDANIIVRDASKPVSPVNEMFRGTMVSRVVCSRCHTVTERCEEFYHLLLSIPSENSEDIDTYIKAVHGGKKRARDGSELPDGVTVSVEDCLRHFSSIDYLPENSYACTKCQKNTSAQRQTTVKEFPKILCVVLNRFYWTEVVVRKEVNHILGKNCVPVFVPERIDGKKFSASKMAIPAPGAPVDEYLLKVAQRPNAPRLMLRSRGPAPLPNKKTAAAVLSPRKRSEEAGRDPTYYLQSVVCHHGSKMCSGHYVAIGRHGGREDRDGWIEFNDSRVAPLGDLEHMRDATLETAYMLFYHMTDN